MKALVGAFNQEKALVGALSLIVQPVVEPMDSFTALMKNAAAAVEEEEEDTQPPPSYSKTQVADKKCIFPLQNLLSDL